MHEIIHEAEARFWNVVHLNEFLDEWDFRFRSAVIGALIKKGFEVDDPLPCLQFPEEILDALRELETHDFELDLGAFRQALLEASRSGILLDVSLGSLNPGTSAPGDGSRRRLRRIRRASYRRHWGSSWSPRTCIRKAAGPS